MGGKDEDAPGVLDHPRHFLRRERAAGDDEVALVLPALVVHYDDELSAREGVDGILDGVEGELCPDGCIQELLRA